MSGNGSEAATIEALFLVMSQQTVER